MFCTKCGNNVQDGLQFCTKCGAPMKQPNRPAMSGQGRPPMGMPNQPQMNQMPPMAMPNQVPQMNVNFKSPKKAKKISKAKIILISTAVGVVVISGALIAWYLNSPIKELNSYISDSEYSDVVELYNDDIADTWMASIFVDKKIKSLPDEILNKFDLNELDFEQAQESLNAFKEIDNDEISDLIEAKIKVLINQNKSKTTQAEAEKELENGNYLEAIDKYEQLDKDSEAYQAATEKIAQAKQSYKEEILAQTQNATTEKDYTDYISLVNTAMSVLPNDADLNARKESLQTSYTEMVKSDTLTKVGNFVKENDFISAFELIEEKLVVLEDDADLKSLMSSTTVSYVTYVKNAVATNGDDFEKSLKAINDAIAVLPDNSELKTLKTTTGDSYATFVTSKANQMKADGDFDGAIELIEKAISTIGTNDSLSTLLSEVQANKPVKLCDLTVAESDRVEQLTDRAIFKDTVGNIYDPGNLYAFNPNDGWGGNGEESYVKINLAKEYVSLKFDMAVSIDKPDYKGLVAISVFGDDNKLLYSQESISRSTTPNEIEVDVTGVEWIYISVKGQSSRPVKILVSDPVLYK